MKSKLPGSIPAVHAAGAAPASDRSARRIVGSAALILLLISCNLMSVVLAKVVGERFSLSLPCPELLLLLVLVGCWGGTYLVRLLLWLVVGKKFQLSFLYPILEINYFLLYVVGIWFWHEQFSWKQTGALGLICVGILLITSSRHRLTEEVKP